MKFSEKWLREWVNPSLDSENLAAGLTMAGLEVDAILSVANPFTKIVVGKVLEVAQHPNADRLKVCSVDVGEDAPLNIVCGASNVRATMKVPVALIGAVLSPAMTIQKTKLRGVESYGMLCSSTELGIADKSQGLLELPQDAPIGADLKEYLDLNDHVFELKITPNRGDCLSILGIAREVSAITNSKINFPGIKNTSSKEAFDFPIKITETAACPRYLGRVIKGVNINATTPIWLKEKLRRSNIRSINPIVDVTNYVMLELGQPLHAFDLQKLKTSIEVRFAKNNEKIKLLNEQEINLDSKTLLIADANQPLAIAGVMGGISSSVDENTQAIFLESAFFEPKTIAYATQKYRLVSDAAQRFERGVDPEIAYKAMERATQLIIQIAGGEAGKIIDKTDNNYLPKNNTIKLRHSRIKRILGMEFTAAEVENIFQKLNFDYKKTSDGWEITPPSYRFDIQLEVDLIEELARIYGYQNIPIHMPNAELQCKIIPENKITLDRIRRLLIDRDYFEAITYSFVSSKLQQILDPLHEAKALLNPISSDMDVMRTTLWPGLMMAIIYNLNRQESRVRLFETGLCFIQDKKELLQTPHLAGAVVGSILPEQWGAMTKEVSFFDIKSDVEALASLTGKAEQLSFRPCTLASLQSNQAADIYLNEKLIGYVGRLHPKILEKLDIKQPVFLFELDLNFLQEGTLPKFKSLSRFPIVRRDIALIVDQAIPATVIQQEIMNNSNQLLKNVKIFDIYQGKSIEGGKKSIALGLLFQHYDRTLVDAEVNEEVMQIVGVLKKKFNAKLRE